MHLLSNTLRYGRAALIGTLSVTCAIALFAAALYGGGELFAELFAELFGSEARKLGAVAGVAVLCGSIAGIVIEWERRK